MQVGQNVVYPHDAVWRNQQGNTPGSSSLLCFGRKKVFAKKEKKKKNWQKSLIKAIKGNENQTALSRAKMDDEQSQDGWCACYILQYMGPHRTAQYRNCSLHFK